MFKKVSFIYKFIAIFLATVAPLFFGMFILILASLIIRGFSPFVANSLLGGIAILGAFIVFFFFKFKKVYAVAEAKITRMTIKNWIANGKSREERESRESAWHRLGDQGTMSKYDLISPVISPAGVIAMGTSASQVFDAQGNIIGAVVQDPLEDGAITYSDFYNSPIADLDTASFMERSSDSAMSDFGSSNSSFSSGMDSSGSSSF